MTETAHDLVQRGAALLDEKLPGWADQIDLDTLQMADGCRCVLGQIGGREFNLDALGWHEGYAPNYERLARLVFTGYKDECAHGFNQLMDSKDHPIGPPFDDLQDAWKGEIVARRTLDAR